jgi:colanic acid/amylovoran biosynthesis glycosyltransferase
VVKHPKVAYVLLWFPKPSETFIFREVVNLWKMGFPLEVFTLYGKLTRCLAPEMITLPREIQRLGIGNLRRAAADVGYWHQRNQSTTSWLFRNIPVRRWRSIEVAGENLWAFLSGFTLARLFEAQGMEHLHAPWANGPATAAWVASRLTGIPFSFMGRAVDIYPPDGALKEKIRDCAFLRTNPKVNVEYLKSFADGDGDKIHLTYDGYPLEDFREAPVLMQPPYKLLSLGRLDRIKGFDVLLRAAKQLDSWGMDFHLTMAGEGPRGLQLRFLCKALRLTERVSFPGFLPYHRVSDCFRAADVFVMPSVIHRTGERDGIPNVILEALLHRVPVVASDVGGISEVIEDGETGFLVPPDNPTLLAQAIVRMTRDRKAALAMAERGRARVLEIFDPQRCHREVVDLFLKNC